jgi:beta-apo-4'-carotenal oxygenase
MSSSNPFLLPYSSTPVDAIEGVHARLTQTFLSGKTRDIEFRKTQLRKLYYALVDNREYIHAALKADLNKPVLEASMGETTFLEADIMKVLGKLDEWAAPETPETDLMYKFMGPKLTKCPMGTVLIIGCVPPPGGLELDVMVGR